MMPLKSLIVFKERRTETTIGPGVRWWFAAAALSSTMTFSLGVAAQSTAGSPELAREPAATPSPEARPTIGAWDGGTGSAGTAPTQQSAGLGGATIDGFIGDPRQIPQIEREIRRRAIEESIIGPDGEPIDLSGQIEEEWQRIYDEHYPRNDPKKRWESLRRSADYLFRKGRISQMNWEQIVVGKTCMYGPAPVPQGMTRTRLDEILNETAHLPPKEQWERIMREPPRDPVADAIRPSVLIPAPDGPNCITTGP